MSRIHELSAKHWPSIRQIYAEGIDSGLATFETEVPDWNTWHHKYLPQCRLGISEAGHLLGWAALLAVSGREVYRGVAELSIYISAKARGKGLGTQLMNALVKASEEEGFWMLQAVVFPQNPASRRLHESAGFREVGYRERIAKLNGEWQNTLLLERRSNRIH